MDKLRLMLVHERSGIVKASWDIGKEIEPDYDMDDLDSEPECDFYIEGNWSGPEDIGEDVIRESKIHFQQEEDKENA